MLPAISLITKLKGRCTVSAHGCWLWLGALDGKGYGSVIIEGKQVSVHRVVYDLLVGEVPAGLELDHMCRTRSCCNPGHLEPVTHRENVLRGTSMVAVNATKVVCLKGHPLSGANLYLPANGSRQCRECRRMRKIAARQSAKCEVA